MRRWLVLCVLAGCDWRLQIRLGGDTDDTDLETEAPDTDEPDTAAPDTAPHSDAPDTDVPDTDVPDTDVPDLPPDRVIAEENALPGSTGWAITRAAGAGQLEGYASDASVQHGESVGIHVSADGPHSVSYEVYRMGYYGGLGGRLVAEGGPHAIDAEDAPTPDPTTGLVACEWPATFTLETGEDWVSGIYLVKLIRDDGLESWVPLVVRADERKGVGVFQAAITTWQAYNAWGGESLYGDALGLRGGHAYEVSFDRPYQSDYGAGQLRRWELYFVQWAESRGYALTYLTNLDLERDPSLLLDQRLFLSVGHDEYWSAGMRDAVEDALAAGTNLAFFSANSVYWQVRLEDDLDTMVCYKDYDASSALDPLYGTPETTVKWRDAPVSRPENGLLGVMYNARELVDFPFVVSDASHWVYAGTGVRKGDVIPLLVGYESDGRADNGHEPAGLRAFASGPVLDPDSAPAVHDGVAWEADSGAFVVSMGTIQWSWGLARSGYADARVQRMTDNVLQRAGLVAETTGSTFGAGTWPTADLSRAGGDVSTLAGDAFDADLVDGPAIDARFDRPTRLTVAPNGDLYVADTGNHVIRRIANDADRTVTTIVGTGVAGMGAGPGLSAALDTPNDVVVDADGDLYVADTGNRRIVHVANDGQWTVTHLAGSASGLAGNADGLGTAARFKTPTDLELVDGTLYALDGENNRLARIDASGDVTSVIANGAGSADGPTSKAQLYSPTALAAIDGDLWIVDSFYRRIRRLDLTTGELSTVAGSTSGFADGDALFAQLMPFGGIAGEDGAVYFADTSLRVRRLEDDVVSTYAGSGRAGADDGPAKDATFGVPMGLALLADGTLLVVDNGSSTIRAIEP